MSAHENMEHAEHAEHAAHSNRGIALLIALLALFLAFSETLGKSAQTASLAYNVQASDTWAFFQAKTIRTTVLRTAAEQVELNADSVADAGAKARFLKTAEAWKKTAERYDDDEKSKEGRKQLAEKAKVFDEKREDKMERYEQYELASAAFQIGIVMASASIITGMMILAWISGALGLVGLAFTALGLWAPHAVHLF